jgi:N-acetyl-gamma-glutamyl-phosphate reductase
MTYRIGILGVSGYGGGETLRLCLTHPHFDLTYVAGESSAGRTLADCFPGIASKSALVIDKWNPENPPALDLLFVSLSTGESSKFLAQLPKKLRVIDIGSDHRLTEGWTYGLADIWPDKIHNQFRVANPGCYPSAALTAIAPLALAGMIDPAQPIIIDAKSGISGAGRGGGSTFGFADVNEDVSAYGLPRHAHVPEMSAALSLLGLIDPRIAFTPHLVPMTRGILATCYLAGKATTAECLAAARKFYANQPFVRVTDALPHTKWALGSNLAFISYVAHPSGPIVALAAIDNLGKGAAGQAIQNANLMLGLDPAAGLAHGALWP